MVADGYSKSGEIKTRIMLITDLIVDNEVVVVFQDLRKKIRIGKEHHEVDQIISSYSVSVLKDAFNKAVRNKEVLHLDKKNRGQALKGIGGTLQLDASNLANIDLEKEYTTFS